MITNLKGGENTKSKRLIIITIFLILLCLNVASAAEDMNDSTIELSDASSQDNLTLTDDDVLNDPSSPIGTFKDLRDEINAATNEVDLQRDYAFNDSTDRGYTLSGITVNKPLTINGNGHTIDARNLSRIFAVLSSNVVIKNITFINFNVTGKYGNTGYSDCGGAISAWNNNYQNLQIQDCTFANGSAVGYGGAVSSRISNTNISNCVFENCSSRRGGALLLYNANPTVESCHFINNKATDSGSEHGGGAINIGSGGVNAKISNCVFENCSASKGGALLLYNANPTVESCRFINNKATDSGSEHGGGAINIGSGGVNAKISNCVFENCSASKGGALLLYNANHTVESCRFINNNATGTGDNDGGGAIYTGSNARNTNVYDCTFINNTAPHFGGAIYSQGTNLTIGGCDFVENKAPTNDGGAIYVNNISSIISNCSFIENSANHGGAIYYTNKAVNNTLSNCNFTNNNATDEINGLTGGALYINQAVNTTISNCSFINNTAAHCGGAIASTHINGLTVEKCNFIENKATYHGAAAEPGSYGGAIRLINGLENCKIVDCNFTKNAAMNNAGGAIEIASEKDNSELVIENCNFDSNQAYSDGGAIYSHSIGTIDILNCNFTNNSVNDYATCRSGGAILLNMKSNTDNAYRANITGCNFINNTAPYMGGALVVRSNQWNNGNYGAAFHTNVTNCTFIGNEAPWGSAIFVYTHASLQLENVVFSNNMANSSSLSISVDKPVSYYPDNVTIDITLRGKDNIANAIWNGGHHNELNNTWDASAIFKPQSPSMVTLKNVTYELYRDGDVFNVTTTADEFISPVDGAENSQNGTVIWQDPREDDQIITLIITRVGDTRANDVVYDEILLTDIYGDVSEVMERLKPGHYIATATHPGDSYYTEISNSVEFDIYDVIVSKVTETPTVYTGDIVNYTISVYNNGPWNLTNVTITDDIPEGFVLYNYSTGWSSADNKTFTYNSILNSNSTITLRLSFNATKSGKDYLNVIVVSTNETENKTVNATENVTVIPVADLSIIKTVNVTEAHKGDVVTWTITVTNNGPDKAENVTVTDTIPSELTNMNITRIDGTFSNGVWTIDNIDSGATKTMVFTTIVNKSNVNITNIATVESDTYDPDKTNNKGNDTVEIPPEADLSLIKTVDVSEAHKGDVVIWTITVTNNGPDTAENITVTDVVPTTLIYNADEVNVTRGEFADNKWFIEEVENGETLTMVIKTVVNTTNTTITNIVNVTSDTYDPDVTNNNGSNETFIPPEADLEAVKLVSNAAPHKNDKVTWTIIVTNNGPDSAMNITVVDKLPAGMAYVSDDSNGAYNVNTGIWTVGDLANGESAVLNIVTLVNATNATIINSVEATSDTYDPNDENNKAENKSYIEPEANLIILKDVDKSNVKVGDKVKFTIVLINLGPDYSINVRVHDVLPKGLKLISFKASKGTYDGKTGVWSIGDLKPQETVTLTIVAESLFKGQIVNFAYVESDTYDPDLSDNNDTAKVIVEDTDKKGHDESLNASPSPQKMYATGNPIAMVVLALLLIVGTSLRRKN